MWRVIYLDFEHPHMWIAFEFEGESQWETKDEAIYAKQQCAVAGEHKGVHVVYEPQRQSA